MKSEWITVKQAIEAAKAAGLLVARIDAGASPYADFALIVHPDGVDWKKTPCQWQASGTTLKTCDPAVAYRGRHGCGILWALTPADDGYIVVDSNDDVAITLCDGTSIGHKRPLDLGGLFDNNPFAAIKLPPMIVTRHPALVEYLAEQGIVGDVIAHATPEQIQGRDVYGVLPHNLSCITSTFSEVPLRIPAELRGQELTLDQIRQYAGEIVTYKVTKQ